MSRIQLVIGAVIFTILATMGTLLYFAYDKIDVQTKAIAKKDELIAGYVERDKHKVKSDKVTDDVTGKVAENQQAAEQKFDNHQDRASTNDAAIKAKYEKLLAAERAKNAAITDPVEKLSAMVREQVLEREEVDNLSASRIDEAWKYFCETDPENVSCKAPPPPPTPDKISLAESDNLIVMEVAP